MKDTGDRSSGPIELLVRRLIWLVRRLEIDTDELTIGSVGRTLDDALDVVLGSTKPWPKYRIAEAIVADRDLRDNSREAFRHDESC